MARDARPLSRTRQEGCRILAPSHCSSRAVTGRALSATQSLMSIRSGQAQAAVWGRRLPLPTADCAMPLPAPPPASHSCFATLTLCRSLAAQSKNPKARRPLMLPRKVMLNKARGRIPPVACHSSDTSLCASFDPRSVEGAVKTVYYRSKNAAAAEARRRQVPRAAVQGSASASSCATGNRELSISMASDTSRGAELSDDSGDFEDRPGHSHDSKAPNSHSRQAGRSGGKAIKCSHQSRCHDDPMLARRING